MKKRIDYNLYIKSPEWKTKRDKVFCMKGRVCQKCGCVEHLQVHHASYNNLGREAMKQLFVLCDFCHYLFHRTYGIKKVMMKETKVFIGIQKVLQSKLTISKYRRKIMELSK